MREADLCRRDARRVHRDPGDPAYCLVDSEKRPTFPASPRRGPSTAGRLALAHVRLVVPDDGLAAPPAPGSSTPGPAAGYPSTFEPGWSPGEHLRVPRCRRRGRGMHGVLDDADRDHRPGRRSSAAAFSSARYVPSARTFTGFSAKLAERAPQMCAPPARKSRASDQTGTCGPRAPASPARSTPASAGHGPAAAPRSGPAHRAPSRASPSPTPPPPPT